MPEGMSREHETIYTGMTDCAPDGYDFCFACQLPYWALKDFDECLGEFAKRYEHLSIPETGKTKGTMQETASVRLPL